MNWYALPLQELITFWKRQDPLRAAWTRQNTRHQWALLYLLQLFLEMLNPQMTLLNLLIPPASPTTHETVSRDKLPKFEFKQFDEDVCYKVEYILRRLRGLYSQKQFHWQVQLFELYFGENSKWEAISGLSYASLLQIMRRLPLFWRTDLEINKWSSTNIRKVLLIRHLSLLKMIWRVWEKSLI